MRAKDFEIQYCGDFRKFEQLEQMETESRRAAQVAAALTNYIFARVLKVSNFQEYQEAKEMQRAKVTALLVKKGFFPS